MLSSRLLPDPIGAGLIYLADTYGFYRTAWYGENPRGQRSPVVYGVMRPAELAKVERGGRH